MAAIEGHASEARAALRLARRLAPLGEVASGGSENPIERLSVAILGLHDAVFGTSGNRLLRKLFAGTTCVQFVHVTFRHHDEADRRRILAYVDELVRALRDRDGACAGALMRAYFLPAKRALRSWQA